MRTTTTRRKYLIGIMLVILTALPPLSGKAWAADNKYWAGPTGAAKWNVDGNWSPAGVPVGSDNVYLEKWANGSWTIQYDKPDPPDTFNSFSVFDGSPGTIMTFEQGTVSPTNSNFLASAEYIGNDWGWGTSKYTQVNGSNTCAWLYIYGSGDYNIWGGWLNATNINVYNSSLNTTRGYLRIKGGSVASSNMNIYSGGALLQDAGTLEAGLLSINADGKGNLSGGTLNAANLNLNSGGTFNQTGGTLRGTFNQLGGTVTGTLTNNDTFNYYSGDFSGKLINKGQVLLSGLNFTAGNGMINYGLFNGGYTLTFNGDGLINNSDMYQYHANILQGSGPITNNGLLELVDGSSIRGSNNFTNKGILNVLGKVSLQKTGTQTNNGVINLNPYYSIKSVLSLTDQNQANYTLTNNGLINLQDNGVIWKGTLINGPTGTINGGGLISSTFTNNGLLQIGSALYITNAFTNNGIINPSSTLMGGDISNYGTIEGGSGTVANKVYNHGMVGVGGGGKLTILGLVSNNTDGFITVHTDAKLILNQGMSFGTNSGTIVNTGGYFDNNGKTLTNNGLITSFGKFATGGLTNNGKIYFTGEEGAAVGSSMVLGTLTNAASGNIYIYYPVVFTNKVTNYGTIKTYGVGTSSGSIFPLVFAGTYEEHGTYNSDPASQLFSSVTIASTGFWTGGVGDSFAIEHDFINQSTQNLLWNTVKADLTFTPDNDNLHLMHIPGTDKGAERSGFKNNFAWGTLDVSGQILNLMDGNDTLGGAFYVSELLGASVSGSSIANIFGHGLNIYYDPLLAGNAYLHELTYALKDGGFLAPVTAAAATPLPGSLYLVLSGLVGLAVIGRRSLTSRS